MRDVVYNKNVWAAPIANKREIDTSLRESESEFIKSGLADMGDIIKGIYKRANEMYGTDVESPF